MTPIAFHLTEVTESLARIQMRLCDQRDATITGTLTGPRCRYARTLPAVFPIRTDGEILVTDPCYWTTDLPFLYDLRLEARQGNRIVDRREQSIGLKRLHVRGPHLFVDGKRFVFRAACFRDDQTPDWAAWRETRLAIYVVDPDEKLCEEASEQGVWIISESRDPVANLPGMNHPAVAIVVVSHEVLANVERSRGGPLIGVRIDSESSAPTSADVLIYHVDNASATKLALAEIPQPAIAVQSGRNYQSLAEARSACEQLQRVLAPELNLAGYVA